MESIIVLLCFDLNFGLGKLRSSKTPIVVGNLSTLIESNFALVQFPLIKFIYEVLSLISHEEAWMENSITKVKVAIFVYFFVFV